MLTHSFPFSLIHPNCCNRVTEIASNLRIILLQWSFANYAEKWRAMMAIAPNFTIPGTRLLHRWIGTRSIMRLGPGAVCLILSTLTAVAAGTDRWRFSLGEGGVATASLFSEDFLPTGSGIIRYRPTLTILCKPTGTWSQWLQLNDPLGEKGLAVSVSIDGAPALRENWAAGPHNQVFVRDGADSVTRLLNAGRLRLAWKAGYFSTSEEVDFLLTDIKQATMTIANACGMPAPFSGDLAAEPGQTRPK